MFVDHIKAFRRARDRVIYAIRMHEYGLYWSISLAPQHSIERTVLWNIFRWDGSEEDTPKTSKFRAQGWPMHHKQPLVTTRIRQHKILQGTSVRGESINRLSRISVRHSEAYISTSNINDEIKLLYNVTDRPTVIPTTVQPNIRIELFIRL